MVENDESKLPNLEIMRYCPKNTRECDKQEEIKKGFNPFQVFLDIPYSPEYKKYEEVIRETLEQYGLQPILAETKRSTP